MSVVYAERSNVGLITYHACSMRGCTTRIIRFMRADDAFVFSAGEASKDSQMLLNPSLPDALTINSCHAHHVKGSMRQDDQFSPECVIYTFLRRYNRIDHSIITNVRLMSSDHTGIFACTNLHNLNTSIYPSYRSSRT